MDWRRWIQVFSFPTVTIGLRRIQVLPIHLPHRLFHSFSQSISQNSSLQNCNILCYFYSSFYAKKFAYVTNFVSDETRQVSYKSYLREQPCFFFYQQSLHARHVHAHSNSAVSHFSCYNHISEYRKLAQKEYKTRHNWVENVMHRKLCKRLKFDHLSK